jgi:hypothetical protein
MTEASYAVDSTDHPPRLLDPCPMMVACLAVLMVVGLLPALRTWVDAGSVPPTIAGVNPNTAPWQELTVLPRIGETIACRIVSYRESLSEAAWDPGPGKAFRRPADLTDVRGIGPITVRRVAPYLHFDDG